MNPRTRRFVTADDYEGQDREPASLQKYIYAGGDPVNRTDPTGHTFIDRAQLSEISITFGQGTRHLIGTALTQAEVEAAITQAIREIIATGQLSGNFFGLLEVKGVGLVYRAFILSNVGINVATYYPR